MFSTHISCPETDLDAAATCNSPVSIQPNPSAHSESTFGLIQSPKRLLFPPVNK